MVDTQPLPMRIRPTTRAMVVSSPASSEIRRSGPNGLDAERTKAQLPVTGPRQFSGTSASSAA
jgi:hypothetical protein